MTISTPLYGITWDEPDSFFAGVEKIDEWIGACKDEFVKGNWAKVFSRELTRVYWQPPTKETQRYDFYNNHPPLPRITGYIAWILFRHVAGDTVSMRLGACFIYALMIMVIFVWTKERSLLTGILAVIFSVTIPRLFAFGHFLTTEIFLTAFWIFSGYTFWRAIHLNNKKRYALFWIIFGFAINIKFTALMIPIPFFLYALMKYRERFVTWLAYSPICIVVAYILNPTWWHDPVNTFFQHHLFLSLFRESYFNITAFYWGEITPVAPWHYPLTQICITTPVIILVFIFASIYLVIRDRREWELNGFALLNIIMIVLIVSSPGTPKYDGVRLFLPVFPFIAIAAAQSITFFFEFIRHEINKKINAKWAFMIQIVLVSVMSIYQICQVWLYHPFQLSYYNEMIGGLRGAAKAGMEITYWQEALTPEFIEDLNRILPSGATLAMYPAGFSILDYYQKEKMLRGDIKIVTLEKPQQVDFIILVNRKSADSPKARFYLSRFRTVIKETRLMNIPLVTVFGIPDKLRKNI